MTTTTTTKTNYAIKQISLQHMCCNILNLKLELV